MYSGKSPSTGPPQSDRKKPRPIIVKHLNYADTTVILEAFQNQKTLSVNGYDLLPFADYSAEVSCRCKPFAKVCSRLYTNQIRFTLPFE